MKRFRILVIALLCLTISGVYAAWTFAEDAEVDRVAQTVTVTLEHKANATSDLGIFYITPSNDFSMVIDQMGAGDHRTNLVIKGQIVLQFKPDTNVSQDIKTNGIEAIYYFAVTDSLKYKDGDAAEMPIFTINTYTIQAPDVGAPYEIHTVDSVQDQDEWVWNEDTDCFEYTLDNPRLQQLLTMNTFTIDTSAEYATFNEILRNGNITLYLNDAETPLS